MDEVDLDLVDVALDRLVLVRIDLKPTKTQINKTDKTSEGRRVKEGEGQRF